MSTPIDQIRKGNRRQLSRLLTRIVADTITEEEYAALSNPGMPPCRVLGVTGPPGVGKSTFVNALLHLLRKKDERIGVLALDPSSPFSGGAILGDRIRMGSHTIDPMIFIRSLGSHDNLSGLPTYLPLMLAAFALGGFTTCVVETVGSGQLDFLIDVYVDTTILLLTPDGGDEVQTMKAGVLEVADLVVINKSDRPGVKQLMKQLESWVSLTPKSLGWRPAILSIQATNNTGIEALLDAVEQHQQSRATHLKHTETNLHLLIGMAVSLLRRDILRASHTGKLKLDLKQLNPTNLVPEAEKLLALVGGQYDS